MLDFDIDEKPQEFLIEEYQKFPLHIKVKINQTPSQFFNYRSLFTPFNVNSIEMLSEQTKNQIQMKLFPLRIRI